MCQYFFVSPFFFHFPKSKNVTFTFFLLCCTRLLEPWHVMLGRDVTEKYYSSLINVISTTARRFSFSSSTTTLDWASVLVLEDRSILWSDATSLTRCHSVLFSNPAFQFYFMAVNHGLYTGITSRHLRHTMSDVFRQSWVFVGGTK